MTQIWRTEDLVRMSGPGIPTPTTEGLWMVIYHQELEITPIIHQPMLSEEKPTNWEGIRGPTTILFLIGKEKRGLRPWEGTHILKGGTVEDVATMNLEDKDVVRRMTPEREMAVRREGTADRHGLVKNSNSGRPPTRSLQNSHSR